MTPHTTVAFPRALTRFQSAKKALAFTTHARRASAATVPTPVAPTRPCTVCAPAPTDVWHGQGWQLTLGGRTGLPFTASLSPVRHVHQTEVDADLRARLEPILRTIKEVLMADQEIVDVEVLDSGPHATHFQLMVMARPQHADEGRLALLNEMLPEVDPELVRERGQRVARALPDLATVAV